MEKSNFKTIGGLCLLATLACALFGFSDLAQFFAIPALGMLGYALYQDRNSL